MSKQDIFHLSAEKRAQGYGTFPYVIVRIYLTRNDSQLPI